MSITKLLDRPIAFHPVFATLTGSVSAGVMLSQAVYWSLRTNDPDGWFYKSREDWTTETALSRWEQESARKALRAVTPEFWHEERRGLPAKLFYRVDHDALESALLAILHGGFATNKMEVLPPTGRRSCRQLVGGFPADRMEVFPPTFNTETTSENTNIFSDKRAPRVSGKKRGVSFDSFDYKTLAELFDQGTHEWLVRNCPTVSVEAASTAFLDYHRTRGTSFRSARAILSAWRGWMVKAEERAEIARQGSEGGPTLSEAELDSLRRMGVEI